MSIAELAPARSSCPEFSSFLDHHHGDVEAAFTEIESFIESLCEDMSVLERQTRREDPLTVASVAYRLKSQAKELGIDLLYQSAVQIEISARKNRMGQLAAEIDLMRFQVDLLAQSAHLQRESLLGQTANR